MIFSRRDVRRGEKPAFYIRLIFAAAGPPSPLNALPVALLSRRPGPTLWAHWFFPFSPTPTHLCVRNTNNLLGTDSSSGLSITELIISYCTHPALFFLKIQVSPAGGYLQKFFHAAKSDGWARIRLPICRQPRPISLVPAEGIDSLKDSPRPEFRILGPELDNPSEVA